MFRPLIRFCLRFPWLVALTALGLGIFGGGSLRRARYDVFPEFAPPIVTVETRAPGFAPRDVEAIVTTPIEDAVNGTPGLATLRSQSLAGLSVVTAIFHGDTNIYTDRQLIAERVQTVGRLLPPKTQPVLAPSQSATGTVLDVGVTSPWLSVMQLTEITRALIRPALLAVPGVANVVVFGAEPQQWQVRVEPSALLAQHVSLDQVLGAAADASGVRAAGVVDTPNQRFLVSSHGQATSLAALGETVIPRPAGLPVTLHRVAHIVAAPAPPIGAALIGQQRGLLLVISSQYGANTLAVAGRLERALQRLRPGLARQGVNLDTQALRPTSFILEALHDLRNSLLIGAGLILFVLFLALRDWRVAAISFVAIPLSLVGAATLLTITGHTLNTLSLGGLAIALGEVVDDAIVDVENIRRRLRENRLTAAPRPRLAVIFDASSEIRGTIVYATLSVCLIFLPIFALSGVAGRMFAPLALAYIAAVLTSLLVAVTVTPALSALLLGHRSTETKEAEFVVVARRLHVRALDFANRHIRSGLVLTGLAALSAVCSLPLLRTQFLPRFAENDVIAHFLTRPGTSLPEMLTVTRKTVGILQTMPTVAHVVAHIGHADLSNGHADINKAEIDITLSAQGNRDSEASERTILAAIGDVPGARFWSNTFLTERIHEVLSGTTAPIIVHIFGTRLAALNGDADHIKRALAKIPGATAVNIAAPPATPSISITLKRAALAAYGLQPVPVLDAIHAAIAGRDVGRIYRGGTSWPITVTLPTALRRDPVALAALPLLDDAKGRVIPLGTVAKIDEQDRQSVVLHQDATRVQNVTVELGAGQAGAFLRRAEKILPSVPLAPDTYYVVGGTATASRSARYTLLIYGLAALALILGLLSIALRNARLVALLALNLPFALIGGIAALWFSRQSLSLGASVGIVTVAGITLRNGLMLLSHYRHLVLADGAIWSPETALRGASERAVPILLTALVTALGLLPLVIGSGLPGQEIEGPMAIVVLGGLVTSTPLTLLILPNLAARFVAARDFHSADFMAIGS